MTDTTRELFPVTEGDIAATARYLALLVPSFPRLAAAVRDNPSGLSRAFAAHRITAETAAYKRGVEDAARVATENVIAARCLRDMARDDGDATGEFVHAAELAEGENIAAAIRALIDTVPPSKGERG